MTVREKDSYHTLASHSIPYIRAMRGEKATGVIPKLLKYASGLRLTLQLTSLILFRYLTLPYLMKFDE